MALWLTILTYVWELFRDWILLFAAPFLNPRMLWVVAPVLFSWAFVEFYQEKKGTSLGNAISNGVMLLWVGIDWTRTTINSIGPRIDYAIFIPKLLMGVSLIIYGLYVMVAGVKAKGITKFLGRIRVVTYLILVFSPLFYGVIEFSFEFLLAIILFFPLFYYIVELIDRLLPNPKIYEEEEKEKEMGELESLGSSLAPMPEDLAKSQYAGIRPQYPGRRY
ncbi:MAG TPA: hypothetical protein VJI46_05495 [Candidatus Nanoarchaeia archaeon]|nr:hypothetical protein [Candidatus Nanoarchaeia archaeon]